jgi:hypothetical protein
VLQQFGAAVLQCCGCGMKIFISLWLTSALGVPFSISWGLNTIRELRLQLPYLVPEAIKGGKGLPRVEYSYENLVGLN